MTKEYYKQLLDNLAEMQDSPRGVQVLKTAKLDRYAQGAEFLSGREAVDIGSDFANKIPTKIQASNVDKILQDITDKANYLRATGKDPKQLAELEKQLQKITKQKANIIKPIVDRVIQGLQKLKLKPEHVAQVSKYLNQLTIEKAKTLIPYLKGSPSILGKALGKLIPGLSTILALYGLWELGSEGLGTAKSYLESQQLESQEQFYKTPLFREVARLYRANNAMSKFNGKMIFDYINANKDLFKDIGSPQGIRQSLQNIAHKFAIAPTWQQAIKDYDNFVSKQKQAPQATTEKQETLRTPAAQPKQQTPQQAAANKVNYFNNVLQKFNQDTGNQLKPITMEQLQKANYSFESLPQVQQVMKFQQQIQQFASKIRPFLKTAQQVKPQFKIDGLWGEKSQQAWQNYKAKQVQQQPSQPQVAPVVQQPSATVPSAPALAPTPVLAPELPTTQLPPSLQNSTPATGQPPLSPPPVVQQAVTTQIGPIVDEVMKLNQLPPDQQQQHLDNITNRYLQEVNKTSVRKLIEDYVRLNSLQQGGMFPFDISRLTGDLRQILQRHLNQSAKNPPLFVATLKALSPLDQTAIDFEIPVDTFFNINRDRVVDKNVINNINALVQNKVDPQVLNRLNTLKVK
jgi:hypothetical protein